MKAPIRTCRARGRLQNEFLPPDYGRTRGTEVATRGIELSKGVRKALFVSDSLRKQSYRSLSKTLSLMRTQETDQRPPKRTGLSSHPGKVHSSAELQCLGYPLLNRAALPRQCQHCSLVFAQCRGTLPNHVKLFPGIRYQ